MKSYIERAIEMARAQRKHGEVGRQADEDARVGAKPDPQRTRRRHAIAAPSTDGAAAATSRLPPIDLTRAPPLVTDAVHLQQNRVLVEGATSLPAGNAYRMLRTRVLRQMRNNNWRRLGVTAARPGEGKTVTAINLALAIAAERTQPVVLVDLDLRRPRVNRYLGIPDSRFTSIADYLEGRTNSIDQLVCTLAEQNLHCVFSANPVEHSSDLLASPQGQAFLGDLAERLPGAMLIFDLPPLLSTDDPQVAAPMLDAMLLVVAEGGSPREEIASAAKMLGEFNLLGVVLNKSVERGEQGYYDY
jgi:Mrp family chromosome partitioning ATPase